MTNDHKLDTLKTPEICSLTALSMRSAESKVPTWPLSSSRHEDRQHALSLPTLGATGAPWREYPSPFLHRPPSTVHLQCRRDSFFLFLLLSVFSMSLENGGWSSLNILNLFIAVKTHFPNKIWKLQQFQDMRTCLFRGHHSIHYQRQNAAAAAAKSLQSCPTLCDPIDGSPPGSPCPWDSPGKNTGVGCHFLLQCMKVKSESEVAQSCPTLRDPMDCSLPGSSIHGICQNKEVKIIDRNDVFLCDKHY